MVEAAPSFAALLDAAVGLPTPAGGNRMVSIVTPFLNGDRFFNETMRAVVAQTHTDWELLLVDDGSTDASRDKALALAAAHPARFRYFEHPQHANKGQAASRNLALQHIRGTFVALLDVDDVWLPQKLARQVDILERFPQAAMVYGPLVYWYGWTGNKEDMHRDFVSPHGTRHDTVIPPPTQLLQLVTFRDGLPAPSSVLLQRWVIDAGIRFDESFGMYEDEVFLAQIALRYPVYLMSESFDRYRQHADSFCAQAMRSGEYQPNQPNPARGAFLRWLERHVINSGLDAGGLLQQVRAELEPYRARHE
jgi:glycosyltransferase involved in cell wall biosynthesis